MGGCNCDYGCPCNFNARPTYGFCQGVVGFQVEDGAYGDIRLDGLRTFLALKWPAAIHEGNGIAAIFVDERGSPAQQDALYKIVSGAAGGPPWAVYATTWSRVLGPYAVSINMKAAGKESVAWVDGKFKIAFQAIRNPVTKAESFPRVVLPQGFAFKEGEVYALDEFWCTVNPELQFAHPGKLAEFAKVSWQGP
jgi:hypothetical protein